jgi:Nitrile hydratase, alpha chain
MSNTNQKSKNSMTKYALEKQLISRIIKDNTFKKELLNNPQKIVGEMLGTEIPQDYEIKVFEQPANTLYLVIPEHIENNSSGAELTEEDLEAVAGGCSFKIAWSKICLG